MLTKITIQNFKQLEDISFNLAQSVVIVGPNNAGKTTVFQALCLWELGVRTYFKAKETGDLSAENTAVLNRLMLVGLPIAHTKAIWSGLKTEKSGLPVPITISVEGENEGENWACETVFLFANQEVIEIKITKGMDSIAKMIATNTLLRCALLPSASSVKQEEHRLTSASTARLLSEGRTGEVLRNICLDLYEQSEGRENGKHAWNKLVADIQKLFGIRLKPPILFRQIGILQLEYTQNGVDYDISHAGLGFMQTLLLLTHLYAQKNTILLLDEPDAHLEVIRQRQIFRLLNDVAAEVGSQILVASHSEVILNEGAERSNIIAIVENRVLEINKIENPAQFKALHKALTQIGWDKYYLARQKGHILYLEGSTDFAMLEAFAKKLNHPVLPLLEQANVTYLNTNVPHKAVEKFEPLKQFFPELRGLALFDRLENIQYSNKKLETLQWKKRELENYFATPEILLQWVEFAEDKTKITEYKTVMQAIIADYTLPIYLRERDNAWWSDAKLSTDWLDAIIPKFFEKINKPQAFQNFKTNYYKLIPLLEATAIDPEITEKLNAIYALLK